MGSLVEASIVNGDINRVGRLKVAIIKDAVEFSLAVLQEDVLAKVTVQVFHFHASRERTRKTGHCAMAIVNVRN